MYRKDPAFAHVDETALYRIVVAESSKSYLIKNVDEVNKEGFFLGYKRRCNRVAAIATEINPEYRFSRALISTIIKSSHDQKYFADHLPSLMLRTMGETQPIFDRARLQGLSKSPDSK